MKYRSSMVVTVLAYLLFIVGNYLVSSLGNEGFIIFFSVGQGDSSMINSHNEQIVTDFGRDNTVLSKLGLSMDYFDREIEYAVATHRDFDHIGGLFKVSEIYRVETLIAPRFKENDDLPIEEIEVKTNLEAESVDAIRLGELKLEFLLPKVETKCDDSNACSVVTLLRHNNRPVALLTGDTDVKTLMQAEEGKLQAPVLKVPHHGSKNNMTHEMLKVIDPEFGVLSYGRNFYGHPSSETVEILQEQGVQIVDLFKDGDYRVVVE